MNYRCLTRLRGHPVDAFYETALRYGHYLWLRGHAGRSLLAVTRALYADVPTQAPILEFWPLPYAALRWIVAQHDSDDFPGNPRISFEHQASRLRGSRQALRRARAWAVWMLICEARPNLPGDPSLQHALPDPATIAARLEAHGHPGERTLWQSCRNAVN
jgi:hypothetical protein